MPVAKKPPAPAKAVSPDDEWALDDGWSLVDEPSTTPDRQANKAPGSTAPELHDWWPVDDGWVLPDEIALEAARVDINTAEIAELCRVPGIGKGKARAIVTWRDQNGRFASVDQLAEVRGFGAKTVAKLAEHLTAS